MEKVSLFRVRSIIFLLSILKIEYTKTKFKNIGKSKFPQLLNKLFETEAIKNKNNLIQSFKRTGIFPFDPSSVDVSRILKNNKFTAKSSTNTTTSSTITTTSSTTTTTPSTTTANATNNDSINNSSTSVNFIPTNNNHYRNDNDPSNVNMPRSSHNTDIIPSFASYRQAISTLDDVLQNSIISYSSGSDDDNDDDDDDYVPPKSILTPSITISSSKKTSQSANDQLTSSRKSDKRKKVSWDFSSTDSTDEGNFYI
jgi:hypothetical protein